MDYFAMISANSLLAKGRLPTVKSTERGVVAGFGQFEPFFERFEFPIQVKKIGNSNVSIIPWEINETKVVYEAKQVNGSSQIIHCNLTELECKIAPLLHLFCFHKINEMIKENKIFEFTDQDSGCIVNISPKKLFKRL